MKSSNTKAHSKPKPRADAWNQAQWESWSLLMVKVQAGDDEAYRRLLNEIGPVLFSFVRRRVFNREMVQDVYQEVLLTFHKARHSYEPGRPLGPWLFTVARNSLLDALGRNRKFAEKEVPSEVLPESSQPEQDGSLDDEMTQALRTWRSATQGRRAFKTQRPFLGGSGERIENIGGRFEGQGPSGIPAASKNFSGGKNMRPKIKKMEKFHQELVDQILSQSLPAQKVWPAPVQWLVWALLSALCIGVLLIKMKIYNDVDKVLSQMPSLSFLALAFLGSALAGWNHRFQHARA